MLKRCILTLSGLFMMAATSHAAQTMVNVDEKDPNELIGGQPIKFAMPILVVAPDARAGGMGDTGVATEPSTNDQNWNAAKYIFIEPEMGVSLSYIPWLRNVGASNINLLYLTGYYKFNDRNAMGAGLRYFSVGSLDFVTDQATKLNTANPTEWAIDFSYSRLLGENFSLSLTGRYIRSDLSGGFSDERHVRINAAGAVAADIGMYYHKPVFLGNRESRVNVGVSITNIGSKMNYSLTADEGRSYFLPTTLRVGAAWVTDLNYLNNIAFNVELSKYLVPSPEASGNIPNVGIFQGMLESFYDAPGGFSEEMQEIMFGFGAEYTYARQFMARTGYYHDTKSPNRRYITLGAGLRYQMFTLDLAYLIPMFAGFSNPLANTIRISLSVHFGNSNPHARRQRNAKDTGSNSDFFNY
jgi:hypothetical protein